MVLFYLNKCDPIHRLTNDMKYPQLHMPLHIRAVAAFATIYVA